MTAAEMIAAVRDALADVNPVPETLIVSPSGSMFDEWEVPAHARREILNMVREFPSAVFACETRAEFVTEEVMREYAHILDNKVPVIEMGLESSSQWILEYCVNKSMRLESYVAAVRSAAKAGVRTYANVLLGPSFLTEAESIDDAVASIQWALQQGTHRCVLFPSHVKPWTLVHWLWQKGQYSPPSLWSLVEVLHRLGSDLAARVHVSWYRAQYEQVHHELGRLSAAAPTTCPRCVGQVLEILDCYRRTRDYASVEALLAFDCVCKTEWRERIALPNNEPLATRVARLYGELGPEILSPDQWQRYQAAGARLA